MIENFSIDTTRTFLTLNQSLGLHNWDRVQLINVSPPEQGILEIYLYRGAQGETGWHTITDDDEDTVFNNVQYVKLRYTHDGDNRDYDLGDLSGLIELSRAGTNPQVQYTHQLDVSFQSQYNGYGSVELSGTELDDFYLSPQSHQDTPHTINGHGGDDFIIGSRADDILIGGAGNDYIQGNEGNDEIYGGSGIDRISYQGAMSGVFVDLQQGIQNNLNTGQYEDIFTGVEEVFGSLHNDILIDSIGNNYIGGYDGNDTVYTLVGEDTFDGGQGNDTISFEIALFQQVNISLENGALNNYAAHNVTVLDFENVVGTSGDDWIEGDTTNNILLGLNGGDELIGLAGDDILNGGLGADILNGGDGNDTADYSGASSAVVVALDSPSFNSGEATGDTYISIEKIVGTSYNDVLTSANTNSFLIGGAGGDLFIAGAGYNYLNGGEGNDLFFAYGGEKDIKAGDGADIIYNVSFHDAASDIFLNDDDDEDFLILAETSLTGLTPDTVHNFETGHDKVSLEAVQDLIENYEFIQDDENVLLQAVNQQSQTLTLLEFVNMDVAAFSADNLIVSEAISQRLDTQTYEVEDLTYSGLSLEIQSWASGQSVLSKVGQSFGTPGIISYTHTQRDGVFDLDISALDENDGASTLELVINGAAISSTLFDETDILGGSNTQRNYLFNNVVIRENDVVELKVYASNGEFGRIDKLTITDTGYVPPQESFTVEAEDLHLSHMGLENQNWASGDQVISKSGLSFGTTGTATYIHSKSAAVYDVSIRVLDEFDGAGEVSIVLGGQLLQTITLDGASSSNDITDIIFENITIHPNDVIDIYFDAQGGEFIRTDSITFIDTGKRLPVETVKLEAEGLISSGMTIQTATWDSSVTVASKEGTSFGQTGVLSFTHSENASIFNVTVNALDENDGESTIDLLVNGTLIDTHILNISDGLQSGNTVRDFTFENIALNTDDVIELHIHADGGEFARIDHVVIEDTIQVNEYIDDGPLFAPDYFALSDDYLF